VNDATSVSSTQKMWLSTSTWYAKFDSTVGPLLPLQDAEDDAYHLFQNQVQ
jgi:hypothetical protein